MDLGDEPTHHHPLHNQNQQIQQQQHRPPSEHIYFSIESDYNSAMASAPPGNEFINSQTALNTTNSIQRPSMAAQQWRLTGTHNKNSAQQPYMV